MRPPKETVKDRLFARPYEFQFFQAVRLLERLAPERRPVGRTGPGPVSSEVVRFRGRLSMEFPASEIFDIHPSAADGRPPEMIVTFMGLHGFMGVLPDHYTELLFDQESGAKHREKRALVDWFDLFNHRLISLFFRAWEKYRFYVPYERGEFDRDDPDPFTLALLSYIGLGLRPFRNRLRVSGWSPMQEFAEERVLARVDDLALLHYSGVLSQWPRCALSLEMLLGDYFGLPARVQQFQGQWLLLDRPSQSCLGVDDANGDLGTNVVAGERVWEIQSKIRIRLGPLSYAQFAEFIPDRSPSPERKTFFLLAHLVRFYVGPTLDFDVQLVLKAAEVPACRLRGDAQDGPRLGWNTWIASRAMNHDPDDAVFQGEEVYHVGN